MVEQRTHHKAHNVLIAELKDVKYRIDAQKETERLKVILVEVQRKTVKLKMLLSGRGEGEGGGRGGIGEGNAATGGHRAVSEEHELLLGQPWRGGEG